MDSDSETDVVSIDRQPRSKTHPAPPPPPFNPVANMLGSSVVPDLMKVYESMPQSSAAPCPDEIGTTADFQYRSRHVPDVSESDGQPNIGRSLRKRSLEKESPISEKNSSKVRKKGHNTDGRWSKRFTWPDDLHRDFVSAIFDVGLKHSSPSSILEHGPKATRLRASESRVITKSIECIETLQRRNS
jgi:hypothetical protein